MKKIWIFGSLFLLLVFQVGYAATKPTPLEGVVSLKYRTLSLFDFDKDLLVGESFAELVDSKPESLTVDFDYEAMTDVKFGSFKLGNNEKKIWFLMGKDAQGYWSEMYIDQNLDNRITAKEKIKSITNSRNKSGFSLKDTITMFPIGIRVSYKGQSSEIQKKISFFITTEEAVKKGKNPDVIVVATTATFLEGDFTVGLGKNTKQVKFRIFDANGNGCYNDYGKDVLYIDVNNDGYFKKNEAQLLTEYFDFVGSDKAKKQMHLLVVPCPQKIAVTEVNKDFDLTQLESQSDEVQPDKTDNSDKIANPTNSPAPSEIPSKPIPVPSPSPKIN